MADWIRVGEPSAVSKQQNHKIGTYCALFQSGRWQESEAQFRNLENARFHAY